MTGDHENRAFARPRVTEPRGRKVTNPEIYRLDISGVEFPRRRPFGRPGARSLKEVQPVMSRRSELLEFAVLGLLHESPMHGYELRKRLNTALGAFRALSYGSLYPALRELLARHRIAEAPQATGGSGSRRARIVYEPTHTGKERFQGLVDESGPGAWEDGGSAVPLAFFARTAHGVRVRILEGGRSRLEERLAQVREASVRNRERMD